MLSVDLHGAFGKLSGTDRKPQDLEENGTASLQMPVDFEHEHRNRSRM